MSERRTGSERVIYHWVDRHSPEIVDGLKASPVYESRNQGLPEFYIKAINNPFDYAIQMEGFGGLDQYGAQDCTIAARYGKEKHTIGDAYLLRKEIFEANFALVQQDE